MKVAQLCPTLCNPWTYSPWGSPGQNTRVGSLSLLQGIFPTQELKSGLMHCSQIIYQLSHKGSPRILEWVAYPLSGGSSWPRNQTGVSCIAGRFFTNWAMVNVLSEIIFKRVLSTLMWSPYVCVCVCVCVRCLFLTNCICSLNHNLREPVI